MTQPFENQFENGNIDHYVAEGRRMRAEAMREFLVSAAKKFHSKSDDLV